MKKVLIFIFFVLSMSACSSDKNKNNESFNEFEKKIIGGVFHQCEHEIFNDTLHSNDDVDYMLILLISDGDCSKCISKAFNVFNTIKENVHIKTYVVSYGLNSGFIQFNYNYSDYVFTDQNENIKKIVKYCYTPCLIVVDDNIVKDALIVNSTRSDWDYIKFCNKYFKTNH